MYVINITGHLLILYLYVNGTYVTYIGYIV